VRHHGRHRLAITHEAELTVAGMSWSARTHREARAGAIIVAGQCGEVLRVNSVGIDGYDVMTEEVPFRVRPDILARCGVNWVQSDLKVLGDARPLGDRPSAAATGQRAATDL